MNKLIKISMMVLAVAFSLTVSAGNFKSQVKRSPEERAVKQTEMMVKKLGLSTDQEAKVKEINLNYAEKMITDRNDAKADRNKNKKDAKGRREAKDAELKNVLTPDQYSQWQILKEEMKQKRSKKHKR